MHLWNTETEMYFDHIDVLTSIMRSQVADSKDGKVLHMYEWSKRRNIRLRLRS